jgi:hypothetical protein
VWNQADDCFFSLWQSGTLPVLEEHLLERISALEYALGQLDERLNGILLIQQLSTESFYDHHD